MAAFRLKFKEPGLAGTTRTVYQSFHRKIGDYDPNLVKQDGSALIVDGCVLPEIENLAKSNGRRYKIQPIAS